MGSQIIHLDHPGQGQPDDIIAIKRLSRLFHNKTRM